jgi:hypothetical protein
MDPLDPLDTFVKHDQNNYIASKELQNSFFGGVWEPNLSDHATITRYVIVGDLSKVHNDCLVVYRGITPRQHHMGTSKFAAVKLIERVDPISMSVNYNRCLYETLSMDPYRSYSHEAHEIYQVMDPPHPEEFIGSYSFQYWGDNHEEFVAWFQENFRNEMNRLFMKGPKNFQEHTWLNKAISTGRSMHELAHLSYVNCAKHRLKTGNSKGIIVWTYLEDLMMLMKLTWQGM